MARKGRDGGVNYSELIRQYLKEHPRATPMEVVAALGAQGHEVSTALVGNVKYGARGRKKAGRKKGARRGARKAAAPVQAARRPAANRRGAASLSAADLLEAKKLADQLGGVEKARRALETLEALR